MSARLDNPPDPPAESLPRKRKLAAILHADVAGFSRLMGADEAGTHRALGELRAAVDPLIAAHGGRIVGTAGDSLLADFLSVVDALSCAVEAQHVARIINDPIPPERRLALRIGVNLGDVIIDGTDIYGDGVNIAARLEALAEPGGMCISRVVRDQIRDKLPYPFGDMGEQSVKNIARQVRVYALRPESTAGALMTSGQASTSISPSVAAPRLSIVVLPFTNLSDDHEQEYFADGTTEDLTTDLSRISGMVVVSRNTAFTYQGKRIDTKQIGRGLNVRYLMEGSVRRSGNRVRVNAQLIDADTDVHLWAERFDGDTSDLFALQDEVTSRIANALGVELVRAEAARPTQNPDALDYIFQGRAALLKPRRADTYREAIDFFEEALTLAPQSVEAQSRLAAVLVIRVLSGMADLAAVDLARAEALVDQALASSPRLAYAHIVKAHVLRAQNRWEEAVPEYEAALALDQNLVYALTGLGWSKLCTGSLDEVTPLLEQVIRLSPRDPDISYCYSLIGAAH